MTSRRTDSLRNRAVILSAAEDVFAQHGPAAPLDLVADAAGVGRATLYRNFEDRSALLLTMLSDSVDRLEETANSVAGEDDALFTLLRFCGEHMINRIWTFEQIGSNLPEGLLRDVLERYCRIFEAPLARAIAAGLCRPDVDTNDMLTASAMLGGAVRGLAPELRARAGRRAIDLLFRGLATDGKGNRT